jgi:prepilin signal peptidase PulO-like enzyme (type II secretory pathway)
MINDAKLSGWATAGLYSLAFVAIFFPLLDLVTTLLPLRPTNFQWRYGALGLAPGYLHLPLLGTGILLAVAYVRGHRGVMKWSSALALLTALFLVAALGVFVLDVMEMRDLRGSGERELVLAGGAIQATKYIVGACSLALLGLGGWLTAGRLAPAATEGGKGAASGRIMTGTSRAAADG